MNTSSDRGSRRHWLVGVLGALGAGLGVAQPTPVWSRPLRIVVPNAPGGAADLTARAVADALAPRFGQPVLVDNRPGAAGVVAGDGVARSVPDGHTALLISSGSAVSAALVKKLPFDIATDFAPVGLLASLDLVLVVPRESPAHTWAELWAQAQTSSGGLTLGTPQVGTTQHLAAEWLRQHTGLASTVVPFGGTPPLLNALRGQQVQLGLDILGPLLPQIRSGALRPLAVLGAQRAPALAQVPTLAEAGVAGLVASSWNGLAVPAATPLPQRQAWSEALAAVLAQAALRERLIQQGLNPMPSTSAEAARQRLLDDLARWRQVVARAGLSMNP